MQRSRQFAMVMVGWVCGIDVMAVAEIVVEESVGMTL